MTLLLRISLSALFIVSTPSAAAPCNQCAGAGGQAVSAADETVAAPGPTSAHPRLVQTGPARTARCIAALKDDSDRLVALHRSIRDGGLGVLRTPTSAFGSAPTAVNAANPTSCDAG
jgi:hypothetical protein